VASRVILCGSLSERYEAERLLKESHPELHVETVEHPWELVEKAGSGGFDVALLLKGPITKHHERLQAVSSLRANAFGGRILYVGAFLTEKQDALLAGADYAFDADAQRSEEVVARALYRPVLAADHPYLRYLFVGDWVELQPFGATLPASAPAVLLVATSCHPDPAFYGQLAAFSRANPQTHCILVEDDGGEAAQAEALASGVQPYVVLAEEGLGQVATLARRFLREAWLSRVGSTSD
jgi:hypothetical protein